MNAHAPVAARPLVDPFGRAIAYVRISVTDRCDYRCVYCMSEDMNFLPKRDISVARRARPIVLDFREPGRAQDSHHRRRAAGQAQRDVAVPSAFPDI